MLRFALTVDTVLVQANHPVETFQLIVPHRAELNGIWLLRQEGCFPAQNMNYVYRYLFMNEKYGHEKTVENTCALPGTRAAAEAVPCPRSTIP